MTPSLPTLILPPRVFQAIQREGMAAYPNECCGLLIGRDINGTARIVDRILPMKNTFDASEQFHRFTIDPLAQARAEEEAVAEGKAHLGYYHSHPDHPAQPSEYDRTHVPPWSYYSHVIVAIEKRSPAAMTAWVLNESTEQFEEQVISQETEVRKL